MNGKWAAPPRSALLPCCCVQPPIWSVAVIQPVILSPAFDLFCVIPLWCLDPSCCYLPYCDALPRHRVQPCLCAGPCCSCLTYRHHPNRCNRPHYHAQSHQHDLPHQRTWSYRPAALCCHTYLHCHSLSTIVIWITTLSLISVLCSDVATFPCLPLPCLSLLQLYIPSPLSSLPHSKSGPVSLLWSVLMDYLFIQDFSTFSMARVSITLATLGDSSSSRWRGGDITPTDNTRTS